MLSILQGLRARSGAKQSISHFLENPQFDHAALCERMRVDRNGSTLSMLAVRLPQESRNPQALEAKLVGMLAERLRITDSYGRLRDGRIGLLLPDTPASGAWKVASDLDDYFVKNHLVSPSRRLDFELFTYPDRGGGSEGDALDSHGPSSSDFSPNDSNPDGADSGLSDSDFGNSGFTGSNNNNQGKSVGVGRSSFEEAFCLGMPWWKRSIDLVGASIGLLMASPVILIAALAVKATSPGGAFFLQEREGLGGRRFRIYKLRTMRHDAESRKDRLRRRSEQDGPAFKMTNDPRVTPVGRLLRKTSLDELPQLWNVLRGEMSLVGPRPLPVKESLGCAPWQRRRLQVTPGITCIWQVTGRNIVRFDDWVRMDLRYIRNRGLAKDLSLLLRTPPAVLFSKGPR